MPLTWGSNIGLTEEQRLNNVLAKMKKQGDSYYSYTIMSDIYLYYDIEDKRFDIYNGSSKRYISLRTAESFIIDMEVDYE